MPWNFPFWQAFRFGIPTLMAGNTTILKHSNVVTGCALAIEDVFKEIGIENVFKTIIAEHKITNDLIGSDYISGVSLTGSVSAGQKIAEGAGKNLKKFVLELGGSDPFIVFEDADLESASKIGVQARNINTGQSCIAAKRFIIVKKVAEEFTKRFVEHTKNLQVGDPLNEHTQVGPLVRDEQRLQLELQLEDSVNSGANILTGGKRLPRKGFFFEPTVVGDVTPDMRVANEEVFGPISPIIVVNDEEEALRVANNSEFGLGASIWTKNTDKALEIGRRLQVGCVFINSLVKSDPRLPFGGIKKSGIGRELSVYGLKEFVNVKAISVY
ncbi:MAG: aldehyde dehydrogenase family protein, partial [Nanoarchaeota archaeon]